MLGEHRAAGGGDGGAGLRHQRAAVLEEVLAQRIQVIAGPRALTKDSSVEILHRELFVMNGTRERGKCRRDKLTPSLD